MYASVTRESVTNHDAIVSRLVQISVRTISNLHIFQHLTTFQFERFYYIRLSACIHISVLILHPLVCIFHVRRSFPLDSRFEKETFRYTIFGDYNTMWIHTHTRAPHTTTHTEVINDEVVVYHTCMKDSYKNC